MDEIDGRAGLHFVANHAAGMNGNTGPNSDVTLPRPSHGQCGPRGIPTALE